MIIRGRSKPNVAGDNIMLIGAGSAGQMILTANDGEILYLKDHQSVDYKGISRYTVTKE